MHLKVLESFESIENSRRMLGGKYKQLNKLIKELEKKPKDSSYEKEIKELKVRKRPLDVVKN